MKRSGLKVCAIGAVLAGSLLLIGCSDDGEDRPGVDVIEDGTGSGSVSGSVSASGTGSASGSATGEPASAGVVEEKPADAKQVDVTLREWEVSTALATVEAGQIYFLVENAGPEDPHEFVVIRTDLAPGDLPVVEGKVPEEEVDLVDEIEPFTPGSSASITLDLEAGSYVLICNIAEVEDGELESHYQLGMRTAFTVE
jgi:uncharacterized cupredoxin-like copper-binding protein